MILLVSEEPKNKRFIEEAYIKNLPIEIGWPCLERMVEARNMSNTSAWPDSCKPPATTLSCPMPSCKEYLIVKKTIFIYKFLEKLNMSDS